MPSADSAILQGTPSDEGGALLRVAHISKFYPPEYGGMEAVVHDIVEHCRNAVESRVIAFTREKKLAGRSSGPPEVERHLARVSIGAMPLSLSYCLALRSIRSGIAHLHTPNPLACAALRLVSSHVPVIITHHADILGRRVLKGLCATEIGYAYNRARVIVATSRNYAESSPELKPHLSKVEVIPLGIAEPPGAEQPHCFASPPSILAIGRLVPYKGFEVLLGAMRELPGVRLDLIGSGPLAGKLADLASGMPNVRLHGRVSEEAKHGLLASAHAIVLPSLTRAEGFGVVLMEGLAHGIPLVTTEIGSGNSFVNLHGVTGFNVPPGDSVALASAIRGLLGDRVGLEAFSRSARERFLAAFTRDRMGDAYLDLYRRMSFR